MDIGLHFILALEGTELTSNDRNLLSKIRPAGIFLDGDNFDFSDYPAWAEKLKTLIKAAKAVIGREQLLVAIDHEGGRVHRVPPPLTRAPAASAYAKHARLVAEIHCQELKALGINFLFGPVCDINSNPSNPVIGPRSFGSTPEVVAKSTLEFTAVCSQQKLLFAPKHFPGHGDTQADSHLGIPAVNLSKAALLERELFPFIAQINQAQTPCIMTAHILFPQLDAEFPATLSPIIINELLRKELGFTGVVISDDLDMGAIRNNFKDDFVPLQALKAGCDLMLFNHQPARALQFVDTIQIALKNSQLDPELLINSQKRIKKVLTQADQQEYPLPSAAALEQNKQKLEKAMNENQFKNGSVFMQEPLPAKVAPPKTEPILRVGVILEEDRKDSIEFTALKPTMLLTQEGQQLKITPHQKYRISCRHNSLTLHTEGANDQTFKALVKLIPADPHSLEPNSGIKVDGIIAGRHFHWRKEISQTLPGEIEFIAQDSSIILVNSIGFEFYITAVVASEMSGENSPPEFARAQAVAARSWAWTFFTNKYPGKPYTLCNDDMSQRYQGTTHLSARVIEAVKECRAEYLIEDSGNVVACYYSKSTGGHGELAEGVFGFPVPGLGASYDCPIENQPALDLSIEEDFIEWLRDERYSKKLGIYCSPQLISETELPKYLGVVDQQAEYFRWRHTTTVTTILKKLTDKYQLTDLTALLNIIPGKRGISGRYLNLTLQLLKADGSEVDFEIPTQFDIRAILHESFLFSSAFIFKADRDAQQRITNLHFEGAGWGHGVGLCQIGALGMALSGKDYKTILKHYFPTAKLVSAGY